MENKEEDETFLNHCVMALQNNDLFSSNVYSKTLKIFLNPDEDEDLRYNAATIIDNNTDKETLINFYKEFINKADPHFAEKSEQWINEISEREM